MDPSINPSTLPHNSRAHVIIGVAVLVVSIATTMVALRWYTRYTLVKQVGADDYLVLVALAFAWATGISMCINTANGLGHHVWDLGGPLGIMQYLKNFYVSITMYNTGLLFVKMTFLWQYYRFLCIKKWRNVCIVAMVLVGCWSASQVLVGIFICHPIAGFWNKSLNAKCIPNLPQWYINAAGNIITDISIFILPMPVLSHLKLPKAQKLVLIGIFSLGFFTCAISVIRIKYLHLYEDFSYENIDSSCWSISELCSGITCACLPTLRPLAAKWMPSLQNAVKKSARSYHKYRHSDATTATTATADLETGNKHTPIITHQPSNDQLSLFRSERKESDLQHPFNDYHAYSEDSGDFSDTIMGLRSSKDEQHSHITHLSPPPAPRHENSALAVAPSRSSGDSNERPIEPSVTTEIHADKHPRRLTKRQSLSGDNLNGSAIRVQKELTVKKSPSSPDLVPRP